jgi:hypothetical protein
MCAPGPTPPLFLFRLILRGLGIEEVEEEVVEEEDETITLILNNT